MSPECDFFKGDTLFVRYIQITSTAKEVSLSPRAYVVEAHTYFLADRI